MEKKFIKRRKLHHDKTIKWDFFALLLTNGTLGHHFKSQAKKSYLYFCHEIVLYVGYIFTAKELYVKLKVSQICY